MEELQSIKHNGVLYSHSPCDYGAGSSTGEGQYVDVLVCRVCLGSGCKLYKMTEHKVLCEAYETLMGLSMESEPGFPQFVCGECSLQLLQSTRLRRASLQSQLILMEVNNVHGHITIELIKDVSRNYVSHSSNPIISEINHNELDIHLFDKHSDDCESITEKCNENRHMHKETPVDDIKVENEVVDDENSDSAGVDIASLQHDISIEVMKAECDDEVDEPDSALWMSGLQAVEVENSEVFNDGVSEDVKYDYENQGMVLDKDHSLDHSLPLDQTKEKRDEEKKERRKVVKNGGYPTLDKVSCDRCSYTAKTVADLLSHLQSHGTTKTYNCTKCSYQSSKKKNLTNHSYVHSDKKPYSCKICKKQFTSKGNLNNHFRIHTGEKPYSCNVCSKSFRRSDHLKQHSRIHTGEKPHACDVCDKSFRSKEILRQHLELHSDKKSYSCEYCNKAFVRKCNLQVHLRIHSGDKPYSCDVCNRKFSFSYALKCHLKNDCNKNE